MTDAFRTASTWVIASHNEGKIREIADLIRPFGLSVKGASELGLPEPEETETTFRGNALLKAKAAAEASGEVALADDSGLSVDGIDGAPGVYSARWAGEPRDFAKAMERVNAALCERPEASRTARFVCALALAAPTGETAVYEGVVKGEVVWPPRGDRGFGYDPIFEPAGRSVTFGEMDPAEKHAVSHRADAFRKLVRAVFPEAARG